jgi:hypothetical protein
VKHSPGLWLVTALMPSLLDGEHNDQIHSVEEGAYRAAIEIEPANRIEKITDNGGF